MEASAWNSLVNVKEHSQKVVDMEADHDSDS